MPSQVAMGLPNMAFQRVPAPRAAPSSFVLRKLYSAPLWRRLWWRTRATGLRRASAAIDPLSAIGRALGRARLFAPARIVLGFACAARGEQALDVDKFRAERVDENKSGP